MPSLPSPSTEAHFQLNQLNIQQIPQTALDKLSSEQLAGLLESTLRHSDKMDQRRFEFAMDRAGRESDQSKRNALVGGLVAIAGFLVVSVLAYTGSEVAAGIVATFLATIIAVVIGSKLLE